MFPFLDAMTSKNNTKKRFIFTIGEHLYSEVKIIAEKRHCSIAEIVKTSLIEFVERERQR